MAHGTSSPYAENYDAEWRVEADNSLLRRAVENWIPDASHWFDNAFARLPETIRVNPLRIDSEAVEDWTKSCLLYTSPSPRDRTRSRMPSSA